MTSHLLVPVDDYLHMSFEGPDREFLDGEIVERNMGELPHALIQGWLVQKLGELGRASGLIVLPEIRIQTSVTRFRVADVAVWRPGDIGRRIPTVPPFLIVEVLSNEDRLVRLQPKVQEYLAYGVECIWLIDPDERRALAYSPERPGGLLVEQLRSENPSILIRLNDLWPILG